jgi:ferric-dicitrate binding protein FerR (iron transport regulator)
MTVQVLGTHFNVNAYADERSVATTLLEGSVKVIRGNDQTLISPGQQVQMSNGTMKVLSDVNTEEVVAWKNDQFYFRKADIRSIMRELSRWYNVKVDYEGSEIEERFYARIPRNVPISEVLKALSMTGSVHFRAGDKTITVSP